MRMRLLLLSSLLLVSFIHDSTTGAQPCDNGWVAYKDQCYLLRHEYESFNLAEHTCELYGSDLAYGKDKDEISFMTSLVSKQDSYGWWYGVQINYVGEPLVYKENEYREDDSVPLPNDIVRSAPVTRCIGFAYEFDDILPFINILDVPCNVRLPYACRGDPNNAQIPKNDPQIVQNGLLDVFWFSPVSDRRSYDDAVKACAKRSMTLLSYREGQIYFIMDSLRGIQDHHVEPWWIGLQTDRGNFSWSNGVTMDPPVEKLLRYIIMSRRSKNRCRILLTDGNLVDKMCHVAKAPFICKKSQWQTGGQYGCPYKWSRAGQSCYKMATKRGKRPVTYEDAERLCAKSDAHPISLKTRLEKTWFLQSTFIGYESDWVWTSLNDKKTPGQFVWADGTSPKPFVLTWMDEKGLRGGGKCFAFSPQLGILTREDCNDISYVTPGCQFQTNNPDGCVTDNWKYFQGHCYYNAKGKYSQVIYYSQMLHTCYADLMPHNKSIVVSPLKVDSPDILDFYVKQMPSEDWQKIWLGIQETSKGVYTWHDGTLVDKSVFKHRARDTSNSSCVFMEGNGILYTMSCITCECGKAFCEKEVAYGSQLPAGNAAPSYRSASMYIHGIFVAAFTFSRLV